MSTAISVIGLLAAAVIFVIAIWKGLDVFTSTILVSFIIILTSWMTGGIHSHYTQQAMSDSFRTMYLYL